ncbi:response regulator [Oleidesulfovibrio sp.]|uniref:response regulator n=1 Tax=Oleidesulfovibrio sp. TaxID=2909707 RepID=UPI003A85234F
MSSQHHRLQRGKIREQHPAQKDDQEFRSLFENAEAGLFRKSRSGSFLLVNTAMAQMFGFPSADAFLAESGTAGHSLFAEPQLFTAMVKELVAYGVVNDIHLRIIPRNHDNSRPVSATEWISVSARAVYTSKGSIRHFEGTVTDITAYKAAEIRIEQLQQELAETQALECGGILARALAEEMSGQIELIAQQTQSALNALPAHSPAHTALDDALNAATEARSQLYRMHEFCRGLEPELTELSFTTIVENAVAALRSYPESQNTPYPVLDIAAYCDTVKGNAHLLLRAVTALLEHVACFPSGKADSSNESLQTVLRLRTIDIQGPHHRAANRQDSNACEAIPAGKYVSLTLAGSKPALLAHGCNTCPPWSTHGNPALAMIQGIADLHGGMLCQGPEESGMATMCLYLPAVGETRLTASLTGPSPRLGSERVLVVDTDHHERNKWRAMLGPLGYRIETRPGPVEGLRLFMESPESFDLVITAYAMPQLNGLEFARTLAGIRPDIPVALCLSPQDAVSPDAACAAGACRLARKPLDSTARIRLVELMLEQIADNHPESRTWPRFSS